MLTKELIRWTELESAVKTDLFGKGAFDGERAEARWKDLQKRVIEHNIFCVAENYTRVTTTRLASLVELPVDETETFLCDMVSGKQLYAKLDRPAGVVVFKKAESPDEL